MSPVPLPYSPLPGAEQSGSLAEAVQADFDALATQALPLRIVRGQVGATGAIVNGTGFTVVHNAVGDYTITYATPFARPPITLPVAQNAGGVSAVVNNARANNASTFSVLTFDTATKAQTDSNFHFSATES